MPTQGLNVGDVLDAADLHTGLRVGGAECRERAITGACGLDPVEPHECVQRGWLMLAGDLSRLDRNGVERLVDECVAADVAGLGASAPVPPELAEAASRSQLVVLEVFQPTRAADVVAMVQRNVSDQDALSYQRLNALQRFLADALTDDEPTRAIVHRLGTFLCASVGFVSESRGAPVVSGAMTESDLREACIDRPAVVRPFDTPTTHGFVFPVNDSESTAGWLILGFSGVGEHQHPLARPAGKLAVPLIEASLRMQAAIVRTRDAVGRATLDELLDRAAGSDRVAAARARAFGIEISDGVGVLAAAGVDLGGFAEEHTLEVIEGALSSLRGRWLATVRGDHVAILVAADDVDAAYEACRLCDGVHAAGTGRVVADAAGVHESYLDALVSMSQPSASEACRGVRYEELELAALLVSEVPAARLKRKVQQILEPLRENPLALETLYAYLENDLDVTRTARALGLHSNSTRYRLRRVEELIGAPLRRPATIVALHVALAIEQRQLRAPEEPATGPRLAAGERRVAA